jgi:CRP/FNR family transcriptional regulator, cyclic AMP receptor protein
VIHRDEHNAIRVLRADPDLVRHLDPQAAELAQRHTITPVVSLDTGPAEHLTSRPEGAEDLIGYLIVQGLLVHRVELEGRSGIELLGRGDIVIPRTREGVALQDARQIRDSWEVLVPLRIAVLDNDFERTVNRWPGIMARVFDRAAQRACTLAFYLALAQIPGVDRRLLLLLWLLADRWGTVTRAGVEVPLRLSHRMLGDLVSAQRPSVTTALKVLANRGLIEPRVGGGWILKGEPPERLGALTLRTRLAA